MVTVMHRPPVKVSLQLAGIFFILLSRSHIRGLKTGLLFISDSMLLPSLAWEYLHLPWQEFKIKNKNKTTLATVQEFAPCVHYPKPVLLAWNAIRNKYICVWILAPTISIYILHNGQSYMEVAIAHHHISEVSQVDMLKVASVWWWCHKRGLWD